MEPLINRKILAIKRPTGLPDDSCWELVDEEVQRPGESEILVEVTCISIDPAMRAWLDEKCYVGPVALGSTMRALGVGRVIESNWEALQPGDFVQGPVGVQRYLTIPGPLMRKIDPELAPPSAWVGALGLTAGLTAYFGILDLGQVAEGETVLVSGAAGAVGSITGQIARIRGARVIGIAGGEAKCRHVIEELGFHDCIDYKSEDVEAAIRQRAPDGLDIFFDNVGGEILDAALENLKIGARVILCGAISQYNDRGNIYGPKNYLRIAEKNARMEGYTVDRFRLQFAEAERQLAAWLASGELKVMEHFEKGIENFPATLLKLFDGSHMGKLLLQP